MKKFNQLFERSAADYKPVKDDDEEVKGSKPRSKGEEDFAAQHKIDKKKHPAAPDEVFNGDRPKGAKGDAGQDHKGFEKAGEPVLKTYTQFANMGGHGGDSYKGVGKSAGEKAPVMQGSSKIKEEVEKVDELTRKTLTSYINKASDARGHRNLPIKKVDNRYAGVAKASKKLDKMEEVEHIDEAFKSGELKLKSGETVKVDEATAKMLNNTFKQLSGSNRVRMESEAMKSKKSFESIVKFAKSVA